VQLAVLALTVLGENGLIDAHVVGPMSQDKVSTLRCAAKRGPCGVMLVGRPKRALVLGALLLAAALALAGCTSQIADLPLVGTPADAPARPKEQGAFLPVNDLPPDRDEAAMDPKERAKLQAELIAARDRQAVATPGKDAPATAK
jgi:hypothetical protein